MPRLLLIAGLLTAVAAGCNGRSTPGGASGSKPDAARKQAETLALSAVNGAADAQVRVDPSLARRGGGGVFERVKVTVNDQVATLTKAVHQSAPSPTSPGSSTSLDESPLQPKSAPRPGPAPIIKERVVSALAHPNEAEAQRDAINAACDLVQLRLSELDPPVRYRPTPNELEHEFLRRDSRSVRPLDQSEKDFFASKGITGNLVRVEYDVEVTGSQVRALRTRDRVSDTLRVFGALAAFSVAGLLFLRADEWTKGYLTRWLAAGAVLLAGGVAAALYLV